MAPVVAKKWSEMTKAERKKLSPDVRARMYHHDYYGRTRDKRKRRNRKKWRDDPEYRERQLARMREARSDKRKRTALPKLAARIQAKARSVVWFPGTIGGQRVMMCDMAVLAVKTGRETGTIRSWIADGTLPGASLVVGRKLWFTTGFVGAVVRALRAVVVRDARLPRGLLRDEVRHQLFVKGESWQERKGRK